MASSPIPPFLPLLGPASTRDHWFFLQRSELEGDHRCRLYRQATCTLYEPSVLHNNCLPDMSEREFLDTCNKSVPFYIMPDLGRKMVLLNTVLHNYVYRRWFRPYQSEIKYMRFICKPIGPRDLPNKSVPSQSTINTLISLNKAICDEVERQCCVYRDMPSTLRWDGLEYKNYILQPLFRALLVVICSPEYNGEDSKNIGTLPVILVSTGVQEGLSAPIDFDSIKDKISEYVQGVNGRAVRVTLEVAVDFVLNLEAREAAVFGLKPDPVAAWRAQPWHIEIWETIEGDKPLFRPSSRYMDAETWTSWQGMGEEQGQMEHGSKRETGA